MPNTPKAFGVGEASEHEQLWAKDDGETLLEHTLKVVQIARQICASLPFPHDVRNELIALESQLAAFHDLGKVAKGFQTAIRQKKGWGHRHEILSTALAAKICPNLEPSALFAIFTHHRSLPEDILTEREKCIPDNELPFRASSIWEEMVAELKANAEPLESLLNELSSRLDILSETRFFEKTWFLLDELGLPEIWVKRPHQIRKVKPELRKRASFLRGLLISADHCASADIEKIPEVPHIADFGAKVREYELGNQAPRPFQHRCAELKGDAILRAPTGSGKTGAALLWAANNQAENGRLFYVLPYTASINAMYRRLQNIFPQDAVGVLHHRNAAFLFQILEDELPQQREKSAKLLASLAHELYHPIRVCTPHQILRVALQGKGWELGLAEFPYACFIFDEIHAFEPLIVGLTIASARWLKKMGAKLIFASATLPKFLEKLLMQELDILPELVVVPNPNLAGDKEICEKIRHRVIVKTGSLLENIHQIAEEIKRTQESALIVCNHVATSQAVFKELTNKYDFSAMLLHARFNSDDRFRIEQEITGEHPPQILVATQAVEVSLNLDYERGYTEPAPADALGQRFGRINRKGIRPPAPVVVFEHPSAGHLYDENVTNRTVELLKEISLLTENQLTDVVDKIYEDGYQGESLDEYQRGLNHPTIARFDKEIMAGTYRAWVEEVIEASDKQVEVLPNELLPRYHEFIAERRYLEARQLLVPIRIGQMFKARRDGTLYYDKRIGELITTLQYSPVLGLDLTMKIDNIL